MTSYRVALIRNRRTFLLCKETGIQKWARMLYENWQGICGPFCNDETKERGLRLLEFATFNDLVLANIFGHHKNPEDGHGIAQMDNTTTRLITF